MKKITLVNSYIKLELTPDFGCHWLSLQYKHQDEWIDVLYPVPDPAKLPDRPYHDGSYILAPWSNRLENAQFTWKGKKHVLRKNFPDGTAIHGDVWTRPWKTTVEKQDRFEAVLISSDFPDFNYPFPLKFRFQVALRDNEVLTDLQITNLSKEEAPVGLGFHPFWKRSLSEGGTDAILTLPAAKIYPTKEAIPQKPAQTVTEKYDLRAGKDLKGVDLDDCFTGLESQTLQISYANPGVRISYEFDPLFSHVVVYSPRDEKGVPKEFIAVEPVSNVTNGFNLAEKGWEGTGVHTLKPEESLSGKWTVKLESLV